MSDAQPRELAPADFTTFFRDVHGHDPFPWQQRLTEQVLAQEQWPQVIDLPTGAGKTAVLDTAIFALAARPHRFPRRIAFVIDRRIVVDQVCERARRICDRVKAGHTDILRLAGERLGELSDAREPLGVTALRGGIPIDSEWTHRPDQPWVMVSTVDQFGSRLLFRGYGVTPGMYPIHAALAGNDCLVILDEVHLSVPFAETLAQVAALPAGGLLRRFAVVEMSATPSNREAARFTLNAAADLDGCDELRRRVEARKEAKLVTVRNHDALPGAVLKIVRSIAKSKGAVARGGSIGVVVNRVRTARETYRILHTAGYRTYLVTGRMRPLDRREALTEIAPAVDPDGAEESDELTVVVATQAIEVGADFNFDALVTECAAVDSLRQRFGRLDRRGARYARTGSAAHAWIIGPKSVVDSKKPDPIYGDSARATWDELKRRAGDSGSDSIDVGPQALTDFPAAAIAPRLRAPLLLPTHMDAWTQTSPQPIVGPAVDWFLHGIDPERTTSPDVSIVWRRDRSHEVLRLVPPRQAEFLPVPVGAARSWLRGGPEQEVADVDFSTAANGTEGPAGAPVPGAEAEWVRWQGFDEEPQSIAIDQVRPGDVLVVDPAKGGLLAGTWDPSSREPVSDLGDAAQLAYGRRATLRLDRHLPEIGDVPSPAAAEEAEVPAEQRIEQWLRARSADPGSPPEWFAEAAARLCGQFELHPVEPNKDQTGSAYYVLTERHARTGRTIVDAATMDGSDQSASLTGTGVTLASHLHGVANRAAGIAIRLGWGAELVEDVRMAGRLHDLGKVDPRFQEQLVGGDPVDLEMCDEPLAKSLPGVRRTRRYPTGMRHELASVALVESNRDVLHCAHDPDLVLHLIATHHGWARPLPPVIEDPDPRTLVWTVDGCSLRTDSDLQASSLALEAADRFWRLVARYGYYGLAWLEAILRLADHQQSAAEAEQP